jgi:tRNA (cmo5U34)-methyltransferase
MSRVEERFSAVSREYDTQRRMFIPCYDDFYGICVSAASVDTHEPAILDVGAGTGLLSTYLMERYPCASYTLIDLSDKMLNKARERFEDNGNVAYITADYTGYDFTGTYDIIASALSIHHLADVEKRAFYRKCFGLLKKGGVFLNADQMKGETPYIEHMNKTAWRRYIESSGLSREEIDAGYERVKLDREARLDGQIEWLIEAGFEDVSCLYKYYHFAVLFARKAE